MLLSASGGVDAAGGAGSRPSDGAPSPTKPPPLAATPSSRRLGSPGPDSGGNAIELTLKPVGPGVYPTRLLLTSAVDVRVIDLELTSQTLKQQFQLEFSTAVRTAITQEIPLVNTGEQAMTVQATLDGGKAWTGGREVSVPAGGTVNYVLTFKPMSSGGLPSPVM